MSKCYQVDLRINEGHSLPLVFDAMKKMQQATNLIDESTTISYSDKFKLTAGFYDDAEIFYELFIAVFFNDMDMVKSHIVKEFPSDLDPEIRKLAVDNICESYYPDHRKLSEEEKDELYRLANVKRR